MVIVVDGIDDWSCIGWIVQVSIYISVYVCEGEGERGGKVRWLWVCIDGSGCVIIHYAVMSLIDC